MWRFGSRTTFAATRKRCYHSHSSLLDELTQRGFIQDATRREALHQSLEAKKHTVYAGVDPTASSLHIGHLIPLICLLHFKIRGHRVVPLIGGATGRVGDPSGRLLERQVVDTQQVDDNVAQLGANINTFFERSLQYASTRMEILPDNLTTQPKVISNLEWHGSFNLLDFLQQVGVHARVNAMLNRESVRARLSTQQGLSFTEFTYQLLQAYDFLYLNRHHGCSIQVGGSDQWGNIVAGLDLIGKMGHGGENDAYGITTPLLTTSSGAKFGKSAGNAVWLNPDLTSIFDFYQYFLKVPDTDVEKYLKLFTLLPLGTIQEIVRSHSAQPEKRLAQQKLADEVTTMVHSPASALQASMITKLLFATDYHDLKAEDVMSSLEGDPRLVKVLGQEVFEIPIGKLAYKYGLTASNSASRALILQKGLYLNKKPVGDPHAKITSSDLIDGRLIILRAGKGKMLVFAVYN